MGLFGGQFANIIEWQEYRDDILFYKWSNGEIKKGSKLIIKPGQDAIFMYNGRVEGVFRDEGSFDVESEIIPFLSTLKGFKFGFNSGMRAEVLFINTKEVLVKWGTKSAINIPSKALPGGMPVRAFGTFTCKVDDHDALIDKVAGVKNQFAIGDVKERVVSMLDQLLMKWVVKEGKDMYNLQANSFDISKGVRTDLDMEMRKIGIAITGFNVASFTYPEAVQDMINKAASQGMVSDMEKYTNIGAVTGMEKGGSSAAADFAGIQIGLAMGAQVAKQVGIGTDSDAVTAPKSEPVPTQKNAVASATGNAPKFCPECGTKTNGAKFCSECGKKLI